MALLLFERSQRVAPFYHEVLPRSQLIALFHRAGSSHERNLIGTRVSFPRGHNGLPRSTTHRSVSFALLRRPSLVIIPLWEACWERALSRLFVIIVRHGSWVAAHNGLTRSILSLSFRTLGMLISIASLLRAFWRWGWHVRRHPLVAISLWLVLLLNLVVCNLFCHGFRTNCRTEMADIEQTQHMIPFVTCEISFG